MFYLLIYFHFIQTEACILHSSTFLQQTLNMFYLLLLLSSKGEKGENHRIYFNSWESKAAYGKRKCYASTIFY